MRINKMPKSKSEHISEPPAEALQTLSQKCLEELGVKLSKKDLILIFNKTKEAEEAEKLFKTALNSWPHPNKAKIDDFREIYESNFKNKKQLSDHEINEAAHRISVLAMMQKQRQAGEAIRATMIKHKPVEITPDDRKKLKELFKLAFDIDLTEQEIEYNLTLSYWFVWYEEGLAYSLPKALNNLLIHYDKKKRGKRGSLQPDDYDIGYLYRWLAYCYKNNPKENSKNSKPFTVSSFIKTLDKEFSSIRSFLKGDEQEANKDGTFTMSVKLNDWE